MRKTEKYIWNGLEKVLDDPDNPEEPRKVHKLPEEFFVWEADEEKNELALSSSLGQ